MSLSDSQLERYSRNILVKEIGAVRQERLLQSRVLVIGAGGLGSPLLYYLAASGVGTIGIVDDDQVDISNLQRQILHRQESVGQPKTSSAAQALKALNPEIVIHTYPQRFAEPHAAKIIAQYDIIADGCDNFDTRFLVSRLCHIERKPLVSAAVKGFEGIISVYKSHEGRNNPCYQCFQPELPPEDSIKSCTTSGVLGAVAGVMGSLMATEVIKEILGSGKSLSGRVLRYNGLESDVKYSILRPDPACKLCGTAEMQKSYA